ncbi:hypothetical protein FZEAL_10046 [Fusarium zealandicum]|uniref:Uncharacterized protein n=1 Tax=Fusarium zealandicum TaxID=1053134 RepID=A0A8H4U609_9HYPO|nr:hypothetical protein FZEAL_10046 [Fusarium zealandicum]
MTVDTLSLAGKVAIVTGSGRENGIGAGIAIALGRNGAAVTINYISDSVTERANALAEKIKASGGRATVVQTNVETPEGARFLVQETLKAFGTDHIDILVNNAGVGFVDGTLEIKPEDLSKTFDVNVKGPIFMSQAAVPHMPPGGRVINITSTASRLGLDELPTYGASKAALDSLTWSWAKEWGRSRGITVNSVAPGPVATDIVPVEHQEELHREQRLMTRAGDRIGTIEDIGDAVLLLVSDKSRWITGHAHQYAEMSLSRNPLQSQASEPPTQGLLFVSVSRPDEIKNRNTQRKIHRHVMKSIGLTRRKPGVKMMITRQNPKESLPTGLESDLPILPKKEGETARSSHPQTNLALFKAHSYSYPGIPSPLGVDHSIAFRSTSARAEQIRAFLIAPDSPGCRTLRELCFTLAMVDDSAMHLALAQLALRNGQYKRRSGSENQLSLKHYNTAMSLVNQQLRSITGAIRDGIIGTVINLASYDLRTDNLARWTVHMAGLGYMIGTRGGLKKISSQYLQTTVIWTDLIGSLSLDRSPYFAFPWSTETSTRHTPSSGLLDRSIAHLENIFPGTTDICHMLRSLSSVASMSVGKSRAEWAHDASMNRALQAVIYDILSLPRLALQDEESRPTIDIVIHEVVRFAMLLFLTAPCMFIASWRGVNTIISQHSGRLSKLLRTPGLEWSGLEDIELWVLTVDAMAEGDEDQVWATSRLISRIQERGLDWDGLLDILRQIAWIDDIWPKETGRLQGAIKMPSYTA